LPRQRAHEPRVGAAVLALHAGRCCPTTSTERPVTARCRWAGRRAAHARVLRGRPDRGPRSGRHAPRDLHELHDRCIRTRRTGHAGEALLERPRDRAPRRGHGTCTRSSTTTRATKPVRAQGCSCSRVRGARPPGVRVPDAAREPAPAGERARGRPRGRIRAAARRRATRSFSRGRPRARRSRRSSASGTLRRYARARSRSCGSCCAARTWPASSSDACATCLNVRTMRNLHLDVVCIDGLTADEAGHAARGDRPRRGGCARRCDRGAGARLLRRGRLLRNGFLRFTSGAVLRGRGARPGRRTRGAGRGGVLRGVLNGSARVAKGGRARVAYPAPSSARNSAFQW
jgi:hypothetical protein